MKKYLLLPALLVLIAGLSFAQAEDQEKQEFFNLEITVGVPIRWTNSKTPHEFIDNTDDKDKTVTANTALGIAANFNFTKRIGLALDTDFFFGTDLTGNSDPTSTANSLFGVNAFLGPVFYLVNTSLLRIPLAVGGHLYYWSSDHWSPDIAAGTWISTSDMQIGPGIYLGVQFHFNRNIYITSRTNVALGIYRIHKTEINDGTSLEEYKHSEVSISWHVKPTVGVGIKF